METCNAIDVRKVLATGETVHWQRFNGEWACGEFVGVAEHTTNLGEPVAMIRASNGLVFARLSMLSW